MGKAAVDVVLSATTRIDDDTDQKFTECGEDQRPLQGGERDSANLPKKRGVRKVVEWVYVLVKSLVRVLRATWGRKVKDGMFCVRDRHITHVMAANVVRPLSGFVIVIVFVHRLRLEHLYLFGLFSYEICVLCLRALGVVFLSEDDVAPETLERELIATPD